MKKLLFAMFILQLKIALAQTPFEPPVVIDPPNPTTGDTIRIGLFHTFYPPCLTLPANNFQGLSHLFEYNGNNVRLTAVNNTFNVPICNPFPISPAPRAWYELGQLPEGSYTLETWIIGSTTPLPVPQTGHFPLLYGSPLSFEVKSRPIVIDTLSTQSKFFLSLTFLSATWIVKVKLKKWRYL